jgi:hypothetical protein
MYGVRLHDWRHTFAALLAVPLVLGVGTAKADCYQDCYQNGNTYQCTTNCY